MSSIEITPMNLATDGNSVGRRWRVLDGHGALGPGSNGARSVVEHVGVMDFTSSREQQRPLTTCRLADARKPNALTIDQKAGNGWTGT
jgi:hypothetical protein